MNNYNEIALWTSVGVAAFVVYCVTALCLLSKNNMSRWAFYVFFPVVLIVILIVAWTWPRRGPIGAQSSAPDSPSASEPESSSESDYDPDREDGDNAWCHDPDMGSR